VTAAIVLAGGRSTRFGSDKLEARVGGRTLLSRVLEAVAAAGCEPIVVVTAREVAAADADVTVSEWPRWGGPCAAVAAGIDALAGVAEPAGALLHDTVILPADLADPASALAALAATSRPCALGDADGRAQWLLARLPVAALQARVAELRAQGPLTGLPARALLGGLPVVAAPGASPLATADIDRPEDLDHVKELTLGTV
jgi:molybdopterin-guanine dinucleotide biosynthesis protein A